MKSEYLASSTLGTALTLALSQGLPPFIGYPVASLISYIAANQVMSPVKQAIRLNQWVAHDGKLNRKELRKAVRQVFQQQGRALYDFYHNLDRPKEVRRLVKLTPKFTSLVEDCKEARQGTLLLIPHLSGFNIGGLLLEQMGFHFLTLSIPNPPRDYQWQNRIRNDRGMEVLPMSISSLHLARERLQAGGTVLTGIDRPHPESGYTPLFFGRPAALPVAYIKLALRTGARDQIMLEKIIEPREEMLVNAQKVLKIAEAFIRLDPHQWAMFNPLWPEAESELP
jgi:lauroyl/myristoyl acyltransferase